MQKIGFCQIRLSIKSVCHVDKCKQKRIKCICASVLSPFAHQTLDNYQHIYLEKDLYIWGDFD